MMKVFKASTLVPCLILASLALNSQAASWRTCEERNLTWDNDRMTLALNTTSMPVGSVWDTKAQYMMSAWNFVPGSDFRFYVTRDTDGSTNTSNGLNEVSFKDKPNETYLGLATSRWECWRAFSKTHSKYLESDIEINTAYRWTTSSFTGGVQGEPYNFQLVFLHELGHALGLNHQNDTLATMNSNYSNGGSLGHTDEIIPHGDDRFGLRILYPDASTGRDVVASKFKNSGPYTSLNGIYGNTGWTSSIVKGSA